MTPEIPNVGHAAQQQSTSQSNVYVFMPWEETGNTRRAAETQDLTVTQATAATNTALLYTCKTCYIWPHTWISHFVSFLGREQEYFILRDHFTPPVLHQLAQSVSFWGRREDKDGGHICRLRSAALAQWAHRSEGLHKTVAFQPNRPWHGDLDTTWESDTTFKGN